MALQLSWLTESGVLLDTAYVKCVEVDYRYHQKGASVYIWVFRDKMARDAGLPPVVSREYRVFDPEEFNEFFGISEDESRNENVIKQAYQYLKTKPEFENAVDV